MYFVMTRDTFWASVGEPLGLLGILSSILFEVVFFTTSDRNRKAAGSSEEQWLCVCRFNKRTTSMPSPRARTDREQVPETRRRQGPVDKSVEQVYQDQKGMNRHWHASPLKARWRTYVIYTYIHIYIYAGAGGSRERLGERAAGGVRR